MDMDELSKIANKFQTKLAQQGLEDVKHIRDMAFDLARHMHILEGAAQEGGDFYESIDDPIAAKKRMFKVRRLLNSIRGVGMQMYRDALGPGMSEQTASKYVEHLNRLLAWLRQVKGLEKYTAFTRPLEHALGAFTPRAIRGRPRVTPGSTYTPNQMVAPMVITPSPPPKPRPRVMERLPDTPSFEKLRSPIVIDYGPGMKGSF